MIPYFRNLERLERLHDAARSWIGTPFAPNSASKGRGVSCQKLVQHVYYEAGWLNIEAPDVPMAHAKFSDRSYVVEFLDACPHFERARELAPGDLIGLRIGRCVHHLAIVLTQGVIIHAWNRTGVIEQPLADLVGRIGGIWRPIE